MTIGSVAEVQGHGYSSSVTSRQTSSLALSLALFACSTLAEKSASREFSGVWLYEFEGSTFVEGATAIPKNRPPYKKSAWLDYHPDQQRPGQFIEMSDRDRYDQERGCYLTHPFLVTFSGRRRTEPDGSGHMGLWASEVTVDRMISSKPLGQPFCYDS